MNQLFKNYSTRVKRYYFVLLLLFLYSSIALGKPVDQNKAKAIATSFVTQKQTSDSLPSKQNKALKQVQLQQVNNANNLLYIFNILDGGFVIISGDDVAQPILGYSATGTIPTGVVPDNVKSWLDRYNRQIQTAIDSNYTQSEEIARQWANLPMRINGMVVVSPLLSTAWNQAPLYNNFCPFDSTKNERTVTGCVATGMAQVINYWEYPNTGFAAHTLRHARYGELTANFQNTTYNYALMPDTLKSTSTSAEVDAIATLMYHCGISVDMDYNVVAEGGSSSYASNVVSALKKYWGYSNNVRLVQKYYYYLKDSVKIELLAQRPVMLSGSGEGGGHFFVADGFDSNNYFHINWGWGGLFDGYYTLNALNPGIGGIGGGSGSYNDNLSAIIGVEPAQYPSLSDSTNGLQLTSNVITDKYEIEYLDGFTISSSIKNNGTTDFNGEIAFVVYDFDNTTIFDTIGLQTKSLTAGSEQSVTFTFPGSSEYTGIHVISLITRTNGGQWKFINKNGYSNRAQIEFTQNRAECGLIYKCDFESELKGWTFAKAPGVNSGFVADTAMSDSYYNIGEKSLYISSDGGATRGYEASANGYVSVAYKKLYFEAGTYDISYYINRSLYNFENISDQLYVQLIPANQTPQAYNQYVYPNYQNSIWVSSYSGSNRYTDTYSCSINQAGEYYLTFIFACNAGTPGEIGAAIDNIKIKKRKTISPIIKTENKQGVWFTWQDVDTEYRIDYYGKDYYSHYDTVNVNRYFIPYTKLREVTNNNYDFHLNITTANCEQSEYKSFNITTDPFPQDTCILVPHNVVTTNTDRGVKIEWEGNSDSYEITYISYNLQTIECRSYITDTIRTNGNSVTIPYNKQRNGFGDFYIRGLCSNDTSVWTRVGHYVEIPDTACIAVPKNVYTEHTSSGIRITWQGNATNYEIECRSEDKYYNRKDLWDYYYNDSNYVRFSCTGNEYTIPYGTLTDTLYHFHVRAICEQDTGFWSQYRSAYNINFGERCVPIFDLCGPNTKCTYGSYNYPYSNQATIDFGYKDWRGRRYHDDNGYDDVGINCWDSYRSRHTVCFAGKTDPRCDNLLSTVPPGEDYSIRLGNWYNGEGESVTYDYTIDSGYKLILLLKYAVVLQDPSHSSEQNPHFTLEILDENNQLIDSQCLFADFAADKNATGWNTAVNAGHEGELEYQNVVWKDWTTIGVNLSELSQYGDKKIKIRLTTKDCTLGQHYGYAYFSLSCQDSEIYGMQCATRPLYFEVPEGFNYRWYLMDDITKTSVCNTRRFDVASNDTCSYHVDLISLENENCFYTMDAYTLPRMPQPVITYTLSPSNCTNYVSFTTDSSFVYKIMLDGSHVRDYRLNIDSIYWDFGKYGKSTNANETLVIPNEGDTFNVSLRTVTNNCDNIVQFEVKVPAIKDTTTYGHRFLCAGDTLHYFGKEYYSEGVYYDTLKTHIGCDSIHILTIDLLVPEYKYYTDTICETELPYTFFGKQYNATGIFEEHIPSSLGCDTIIHQLDLTVITELNITVDTIGEVTINDSPISLSYNITKGTFNGYSITFDQNGINNGFVNSTVTADSTANIIFDIPQNATPGRYSATITFYNDNCNDVIIPFEFTLILYSKPNSDADLKLNVHDCTNEIIITNNSNVLKYYTLTDVIVDTETPIDSVRWDFGIYGTSAEFTPSLIIPVAGDTISVSLTTYAGIYSDTKTYTIEVPSIIPDTGYTYATICNGDSYVYNGVTYNTEGRHITSTTPNINGCDSAHVLVLTFITPETTETYDSICSNNLPYNFYGQNCTASGTYTHVVSAQGGCDSLIYILHLVLYDNIDITIADFGEICGDDVSFLLSYEINSGNFSSGEIRFGTLATQAGFENVQFSAGESTFSIQIPNKIRPDEYEGELVFNIFDCMENRFPFKFTILYPSSIIIQRWNDFLGVSNASYNGGYTFSDYQWYLNDTPIESYKPSQIYEEGKELDFNGEYRVLLTRIDDGKAIMTCPFTPVRFNEDDYTAMNTIVYTNEVITATSTSNAHARIYNSIGVVIDSYTICEGETSIKMPAQAGMYTLNIIYDSGKVQNIKIIVRE